jgi:hypothetical protein
MKLLAKKRLENVKIERAVKLVKGPLSHCKLSHCK